MTTTNHDDVSMYNDLLTFLKSSRSDLRHEATKAILQVTATGSGSDTTQLENLIS